MTVELGLNPSPPVGHEHLRLIKKKRGSTDVKIFGRIFLWPVLPFIVTDLLRLVILIAFCPDHRALAAVT